MTTYRVRGLPLVYGGAAVLLLVFPLPAVLDSEVPLGVRLAWYAPLVLIAAFVLVRVTRVAVIAQDDAVVVRNPFRTIRIPWSDLRQIDVGGGALRKVRFHRDGGSPVRASALPTGGAGVDARTQEMIDSLRARLPRSASRS